MHYNLLSLGSIYYKWGMYLLDRLTNEKGPFEKSLVGLYRDDGLAVVQGGTSECERISKKLHKLFGKENWIIKLATYWCGKILFFVLLLFQQQTKNLVYLHGFEKNKSNAKSIGKRFNDATTIKSLHRSEHEFSIQKLTCRTQARDLVTILDVLYLILFIVSCLEITCSTKEVHIKSQNAR